MNILLVEDDAHLGAGLKTLLELEGYVVTWVTSGKDAIDEVKFSTSQIFDVVLLDWMLPELSGLEVCRWLRDVKKGRFAGGIIFLTAKSGLDDCVKALECGADDYVSKPFEFKVLKARIHAVYRRKNQPYVDEVYEVGGFTLNCSNNTLSRGSNLLSFSKTEFKILQILFINHNQTILRETLFDKVWGNNPEISSASLDSYIYNLRKKLKIWADNIEIKVLKNIGYMMDVR